MRDLNEYAPIAFGISMLCVLSPFMMMCIGITFQPKWENSIVFEDEHVSYIQMNFDECQKIIDKLNTESNKSFECKKGDGYYYE